MQADTGYRHRPDDTERKGWQDPEAILTGAGLKPGATLIDLGCGEGFFTLPAARLVGPEGKVYGLDVRSQAIEYVREKAAEEGLRNLVLREGRAEDVVLCDRCADFILLGIVLHDFDDPGHVLKNAARMIKTDGKLINVDWKKEPMPWGPPLQIRFEPGRAVSLIEKAGFRVDGVDASARYHYTVTARLRESEQMGVYGSRP